MWRDVWVGNDKLGASCSKLFRISEIENAVIADIYSTRMEWRGVVLALQMETSSLIGLFLSVEYSRRLHGKYFWTGFQIPTN